MSMEHEWDTAENGEDRTLRLDEALSRTIINGLGIPIDGRQVDIGQVGIGDVITRESIMEIANQAFNNHTLSNNIDVRLEPNTAQEVLELSGSSGHGRTYECPVHGGVQEVIKFTMDGDEEIYCIRCWRDQFRNTQQRLY